MRVLYAPEGNRLRRAEGERELLEGGTQKELLKEAEDSGRELASRVRQGKVWLLGAGPGDAGLLTVRALDCIRKADVIVYDNLASSAVLQEARLDAELIYAGKRANRHHLRQEETNALLVEKALEGKNVARVKGGDPFIFGRGGEEAQELRKAGIEFDIIPGISSSYSAPAYAGIPVTHRDFASSFHVITGHESCTKESTSLNYQTLAKEEGTLVFLMGLKNLPHITEELIANGKDPKTPAAVIQEGTTARQRTVTGTLETISARAEEEGIKKHGNYGSRRDGRAEGRAFLVWEGSSCRNKGAADRNAFHVRKAGKASCRGRGRGSSVQSYLYERDFRGRDEREP